MQRGPLTLSVRGVQGASGPAWLYQPTAAELVGKVREVHPLMWVVAVLFVVYFAIAPLTSWLT